MTMTLRVSGLLSGLWVVSWDIVWCLLSEVLVAEPILGARHSRGCGGSRRCQEYVSPMRTEAQWGTEAAASSVVPSQVHASTTWEPVVGGRKTSATRAPSRRAVQVTAPDASGPGQSTPASSAAGAGDRVTG